MRAVDLDAAEGAAGIGKLALMRQFRGIEHTPPTGVVPAGNPDADVADGMMCCHEGAACARRLRACNASAPRKLHRDLTYRRRRGSNDAEASSALDCRA